MTQPLRIAYLRRFADAQILEALQNIDGVTPVVLTTAEAISGGLAGCDGMIAAGAKDLWSADLGAAVAAAKLRFVQCTTAGHDGIDLHTLPGVAVYGNGGVLGAPVAEHGMALLLTFMRRLDHVARNRAWKRETLPPILSLEDRVMTILGLGAIGRAAARRARAFDMEIQALRRAPGDDPEVDRCYSYAQMKEAFARTDVLFLAAPLTPETRHIINAESLSWLKPGAVLVNVGRGDLVCQEALLAALQAGTLGGTCLDVTSPEPLPADHPLWSAPNTLISPHIAGGSDRMGAKLARQIAENLRGLILGKPPAHVIRAG